MKTYKSKRRNEENYETVDKGFDKNVVKVAREQAKLAKDDFWKQLLGLSENEKQTSEASGNVVFEFSKLNKSDNPSSRSIEEKSQQKKIKSEVQPGIDYHREYYESITKFGERASYHETMQESRHIQQVMAEIRKLVSTTKSLQVEFGGIMAVQEAPVNPGKYYINFFEWMLIMIKQARQKIEDSKLWLEAVQGKKKKKMGYWDKSKKYGTTFSQANERNVATSTG